MFMCLRKKLKLLLNSSHIWSSGFSLFLLFSGNLNVFHGKGDLNSEIRGKEKIVLFLRTSLWLICYKAYKEILFRVQNYGSKSHRLVNIGGYHCCVVRLETLARKFYCTICRMSCDFEEIHYPAIKQLDILKFESKVKVYKHLYRGPSFSFLSCNFICVLQYFLLFNFYLFKSEGTMLYFSVNKVPC